MKVLHYKITLLDPLFYAREGLYGAYTPPLLHATAVNGAVAAALNWEPEKQPLLMNEHNGGRNTPRYENSWDGRKFYFTPAALTTPLRYFPEVTKGENDGYVFRTGGSELFRAMTLNYLAPESVFEGFAILPMNLKPPSLIRLGSFRGKAELQCKECKEKERVSNRIVDHPVDPLVSKVSRGVARNLFPYPVIENAHVDDVLSLSLGRKHCHAAFPPPLMDKLFERVENESSENMIF
jgi:hypothetical protein